MTRRWPPRWFTTVAACSLLVIPAACGLPGDEDVRSIDQDTVPYDLLEVESSGDPPAANHGPVSALVPVTFWVTADERLVPVETEGSCSESPAELARRLLTELALGPDVSARAAGLSSALPPDSELALIALVGGTAEVEVESGTISADLLPLAMGQVVLSLTSAPGVEYVVLQSSGETVEVPLPGGPLAARPVSADDYAPLLPARYLDASASALTPALGCS